MNAPTEPTDLTVTLPESDDDRDRLLILWADEEMSVTMEGLSSWLADALVDRDLLTFENDDDIVGEINGEWTAKAKALRAGMAVNDRLDRTNDAPSEDHPLPDGWVPWPQGEVDGVLACAKHLATDLDAWARREEDGFDLCADDGAPLTVFAWLEGRARSFDDRLIGQPFPVYESFEAEIADAAPPSSAARVEEIGRRLFEKPGEDGGVE